jgi:hypothetical protein
VPRCFVPFPAHTRHSAWSGHSPANNAGRVKSSLCSPDRTTHLCLWNKGSLSCALVHHPTVHSMGAKEKSQARAHAAELLRNKAGFCALISNQCITAVHEPEAYVRSVLFDMLNEYKQCDGLGGCKQTPGAPPTGHNTPHPLCGQLVSARPYSLACWGDVSCVQRSGGKADQSPPTPPRSRSTSMHAGKELCSRESLENHKTIPHNWHHNVDIATECHADYKFVITMDNQKVCTALS